MMWDVCLCANCRIAGSVGHCPLVRQPLENKEVVSATDSQQLKAEIAALVSRMESYSRSQEVDNEFWDIVEAMRQLSPVA